ncbi:hypothetical protein LSCM1_02838 [Leishmania martiniquensis]|uniref:Uncharacterized protein n=1 Tax=Leishmania martiniquensis TaxID=1580590 RepID=A0A836G7K7_9TRYP|nr:hypothetical protein LSCM1_02838 [Leishmania martiniquensis]
MTTISASRRFDPFHVATWYRFIEQDDLRMITCELRGELESAFDVHACSAKCRQSVLSSLLLWANLAREHRHVVQWNSEDNINLGQGLVQHLLDLTAELQGINTDEIYAALRAEQHPFLKKMYETQQSRGVGCGVWRGRDRCAASELKRDASCPISPTTSVQCSMPASLQGKPVVCEPQLTSEPTVKSPPALTHDAQALPAKMALAPQTPQGTFPPSIFPPGYAFSVKYLKRAALGNTAGYGTAPSTLMQGSSVPVNAPIERSAPRHMPASRSVSATVNEKPLLMGKQAGAAAAAPAAPSSTEASSLRRAAQPVVLRQESYTVRPTHQVSQEGPFEGLATQSMCVAAKDVAGSVAADPLAVKKAVDSSDRTSAPSTTALKSPTVEVLQSSPSPPAESVRPPFFSKKTYIYSDSEGTTESDTSPAAPSTPVRATSASPTLPTPAATTPSTVPAALLKYRDGGTEDLLQAFWSDLSVDPDGISAWSERRLAITEDDQQIPLEVAALAPLSLDKLKRRMEPKVVKRVDQLFQYLHTEARAALPPHQEVSALLSGRDIEQLRAAELIRPSKKSAGPDTVLAFTVVESKSKETRRRFLSWPRGSNEQVISSGYEPHVPLHHISTYLDAVNAPCGCVESLENCFDQVLLPPDLQERFLFTDARERRWCLTRLPLGHIVSTEIVQIILSTLCGHPSYTLQSHATANAVHSDVWVHTVRLYGPVNDVQKARKKLWAACIDCSAAVTASSGGGPNATYEFLGVLFDHGAHEVSVDADFLRRVESPKRTMSTRDLERLYTQLLFCSAVLQVAVSEYYKVLKIVYDRLSTLQEHPQELHTPSPLPPCTCTQVQRWHEAILKTAPRRVGVVSSPCMSLFVELTTAKWQVVLVNEETQETWNAEGSLLDILGTAVVAAAITSAFVCFQPCIEKGAHVKIKIMGGKPTGGSSSTPEEAISVFIRSHLVARTFSFEVAYLDVPASSNGTADAAATLKDAHNGGHE